MYTIPKRPAARDRGIWSRKFPCSLFLRNQLSSERVSHNYWERKIRITSRIPDFKKKVSMQNFIHISEN